MKAHLLIVLLVSIGLESSAKQDDYFKWVDLSGDIPENAVTAGTDKNNNTVYVARVYQDVFVLDFKFPVWAWVPAGITAGQSSIDVVLFGEVFTVNEDIQILTSINDANFEWVNTDYLTFPKLFDTEQTHVVRSGWECEGFSFNSTVYIGKVHYDGGFIVGKIFTSAFVYADNYELYFVDGTNKNASVAKQYSALVFYD